MLRILGIHVDISRMALLNSRGEIISMEEFFQLLYLGAEAELTNGQFDGVDTISASAMYNTTIRIAQ